VVRFPIEVAGRVSFVSQINCKKIGKFAHEIWKRNGMLL
jgi:hypothetical protein